MRSETWWAKGFIWILSKCLPNQWIFLQHSQLKINTTQYRDFASFIWWIFEFHRASFFRFDRNVQNSREELFFCDAMLKLLCSNNETNAMYSRWPRILLATNFFVIFFSRRRRVTRKETLVNFRSLSRKWRNLLDRWFSFGITSNSSEDDNKSTIDPHAKLSFSYSIFLSLRYFCLGGPFLGGSRTLREIRRN